MIKNLIPAAAVFVLIVSAYPQQQRKTNFVAISPNVSINSIVRKAANVVPSPRQLAWQKMEFTAFVHFTVNTFTDKEWGDGTEPESVFNPSAFDARQWARVCKSAGMKQIIVTAKHHDGFCLWPSKYTEHSVKNSPWRNGKGDVLKDVSEACREYGLKFGVYLSPWDRHEPTYGDSPKYNAYFRNQLTELLTNYGEVDEVWFDGACGEGPNGKRQVYDFESYYKLIRKLQPQAVIAIMGPDVRWVGTESGYGRKTEWSVLPVSQQARDKIAADSQNDIAFLPLGDMTNEDLGSRDKLAKASALVWYPAEVDVSIRPGWFYHASQDSKVKTAEKLVDIYYSSVGRNSLLLLNLPPDRRGLINEHDIKSLMGMREILDKTFNENLVANATVTAGSAEKGCAPSKIIDGKFDTYWAAKDGVSSAEIVFVLDGEKQFDRAMLQEHIPTGQRIEKFKLDAWQDGHWKQFTEGTTVGYKRLLRFPAVKTQKVRLTIQQSRTNPTLAEFGLFKSPEW